MADRPTKKSPNAVSRNENRPNGKAAKTSPDATFRHNAAYRGAHTRKTRLTGVQKVLNGQGALRNVTRRADGTSPLPWKLPQSVARPYDAAQVEINKRLYPHLFTD